MKTRATILAAAGLAALAGAANAQVSTQSASIAYSMTFADINGNNNGVVEPGEAVRLRLTMTMTPAIGTVIPLSGATAPTGTLLGIGSGFIDMAFGNALGGTFQNTGSVGGISNGVLGSWNLVGPAAHGTISGSNIQNIQIGQFPFNSLPYDPDNNPTGVRQNNPLTNVYTIVWTPSNYTSRTVNVTLSPGSASGGVAATVLVQTNPDPNNPPTGANSLFTFGTANIPIVPAPSSLALLGLGGLIAGRRRR
jgi:hypothetical protein